MRTEELKEYLGIVTDMEENIFLQKNLIASIQGQIEDLKVPKAFVDPAEPYMPEHPTEPGWSGPNSLLSMILCGLFLIYCFLSFRIFQFQKMLA